MILDTFQTEVNFSGFQTARVILDAFQTEVNFSVFQTARRDVNVQMQFLPSPMFLSFVVASKCHVSVVQIDVAVAVGCLSLDDIIRALLEQTIAHHIVHNMIKLYFFFVFCGDSS